MEDSFWALVGLGLLGSLLLGPIGFFLTIGTRKRLRFAEQSILELQARLRAAGPAQNAAAEAVPRTGTDSPAAEPAAREPSPSALAIDAPLETTEPVETVEPAGAFAEAGGETPGRALDPSPKLRGPSFEERLGARWAVWVGGVALALGGVLLVRYSIDQGWLGPAARIAAGLLFAAALVGAGEILRRKEAAALRRSSAGEPGLAAPSQIPAVLTAAGTVAAFGSIYAAHALYGFIGPALAFAALGATGLSCMFATALHGPALAGLGVVGALAAPLLVTSAESGAWPLVAYVSVATACAYGLARLRLWLWLALTAAAGGLIWGLVLIEQGASLADFHAALALIILETFMATLLFALDRSGSIADRDAAIDSLAVAAPAAFALLLLAALNQGAEAGYFGLAWILSAGASVVILSLSACLAAPAAGLALAAGALVAAVMAFWPAELERQSPAAFEIALLQTRPETIRAFAAFALIGALGSASLAGGRLFRGTQLRGATASLYAAAACLTPLAALMLAYLRLAQGGADFPFAAYAGALGALFLIAATIVSNRLESQSSDALRLGLGAYASAALAAIALGLVFVLDHGMLTIALALAALSAAFVERRLDIPALRWCVAGLSLAVAARLAYEPRILGDDLGRTPIFNWLLWGYGVPALAFALSGQLLRRKADDAPAQTAQALAILCSAFLVFFEIRHWINGGDAYARGSGLIEQGLFSTAAFGFAIVLTRLDAARTNVVLRLASLGFGALSFALALFGLLLFVNPLFSGEPVEGGVVFNAALLAYGAPAVMALMLARAAEGVRPSWYRNGAALASFGLIFVLANLQVRRIFEGPDLGLFPNGLLADPRPIGAAELYSYSALWLAFGIILLGFGLWRRSIKARIASAVLLVATVLKVFLVDLAGLEGALRALSFIGLGLVLVGIGLVYQKFIFTRGPAPTRSR